MPFPPKEKPVSPRTPERQDWKRIIDEKEKRERDELLARFKDEYRESINNYIDTGDFNVKYQR